MGSGLQPRNGHLGLTHEYCCNSCNVLSFRKRLSDHNWGLETNPKSDAGKNLVSDPVRRWRSNVESVKQSPTHGCNDSTQYQEWSEVAKCSEKTTGNNY